MWQNVSERTNEVGELELSTNYFTELRSGLHYQAPSGEWLEAEEVIEPLPSGAIAQRGQYSAKFPADIAVAGAIELEFSGQERFVGTPVMLAYTDVATGQSVRFAEIRSTVGVIYPPNSVVYEDCFDGVKASVRYTYRRARFSQDILFLEAPPGPEEFGLHPETSFLQIFTEISEAPQTDPTAAGGVRIKFGSFSLGEGMAFSLLEGSKPHPGAVRHKVRKEWVELDGRRYLVENLEYRSVMADLARLPQAARIQKGQHFQMADLKAGSSVLPRLEQRREEKPLGIGKPEQLASFRQPIFLADYETITGSISDQNFSSSTTYYISGEAYFSGTSTFEGGTIIKIARTTDLIWSGMYFEGNIVCRTGPHRPVIVTAVDDHTVGQKIGTGTLTGRYAQFAVALDSAVPAVSLSNFRISHAWTAIAVNGNASRTFENLQIINCNVAVDGTSSHCLFRNALIDSVVTVFLGRNATNRAEHITVHRANTLAKDQLNLNGVYNYLTNSLLVAVTNYGITPVTMTSVQSPSSGAGVFRAVGAGHHYLLESSPYRNAGSVSINSGLLAQLKKKTTSAPQVLSGTITVDTVLSPVVERDQDLPDLGYHYDPIDYAINLLTISNATLTVTNGVRLATFGDHGFWVREGGHLVSEGTPVEPNRVFRHYSTQEQTDSWGNTLPSSAYTFFAYAQVNHGTVKLRFTESSIQASGGYQVRHVGSAHTTSSWTARDSQFYGGTFDFSVTGIISMVGLTNNLFHRPIITFAGSEDLYFFNNLLWKGGIDLWLADNSIGVLKDNAFDQTFISDLGGSTHSHNAYINTNGRLVPNSSTDLVLSSFTYANGPLGLFYQASASLVNSGSRSSPDANLYHHTTQTSQTRELSTTVDIGFHYVAINSATGQPLDTDGDGLPDYYEDTDGDGTVDAGERNFNVSETAPSAPGLKVFTPLE